MPRMPKANAPKIWHRHLDGSTVAARRLALSRALMDAAKARWDADRKALATDWPMPAWSRAPAWRKKPYLMGWDRDALPDPEDLWAGTGAIITDGTGCDV